MQQTYGHRLLPHALRRKQHVYAIAFTDCRRGEMFHKARAFLVDGEVYPVAWLANDMWQIHWAIAIA